MTEVVSRYDARAGVEADLKGDKHGLALAVIRKRRLAAQAPRLLECEIVRLVQEVWTVPGRVKLAGEQIRKVRLRRAHPRAREVCCGFRPLLAPGQTLGFW